jgi:hypothetical protein
MRRFFRSRWFSNCRKRPQQKKQSLDFQTLESRQLLAAATIDFTTPEGGGSVGFQ